MKILVARIPEEGTRYKGDEPGSVLEAEGDSLIREAGEVSYDLYVQYVSEELVVRGKLAAELKLQCARCSEIFSTTVSVSDFLRAYPAPEGTDSVDISADLREDIILHVPGFPVCSEECRGMCPQCGADLNKGPCTCRKDDEPNAWSSLDGLDL